MFSGTKARWFPFTARFDAGTTKNWISSDVVDRMSLKVQEVSLEKYAAFNGNDLESTEMVVITWSGDGNSRSRESDFCVAHNPPFDVLLGSELLFSQKIYRFDKSALILTSKKETEGSL